MTTKSYDIHRDIDPLSNDVETPTHREIQGDAHAFEEGGLSIYQGSERVYWIATRHLIDFEVRD